MASRHQRRKRAKVKRELISADRKAAFIAHERAKLVKGNLARDNRESYTLTDHLGRAVIRQSTAYSSITDSFVRMVQGGGLRECLNLALPDGMTDREVKALKARLTK